MRYCHRNFVSIISATGQQKQRQRPVLQLLARARHSGRADPARNAPESARAPHSTQRGAIHQTAVVILPAKPKNLIHPAAKEHRDGVMGAENV